MYVKMYSYYVEQKTTSEALSKKIRTILTYSCNVKTNATGKMQEMIKKLSCNCRAESKIARILHMCYHQREVINKETFSLVILKGNRIFCISYRFEAQNRIAE